MKKIKINRNHILLGGLALAAFAVFVHTQRCGLFKQFFNCTNQVYDMGPAILDPDPFVDLQNQMSTRPITDEWVQQYNHFINGYREKPTMFPENYYSLPFRYEGPAKGILTSPGMPHPFFGGNPMDPEPNWHNNWIRQPFSF